MYIMFSYGSIVIWLGSSGKPTLLGKLTNESSLLYDVFRVGFTLISLRIISSSSLTFVVVVAIGVGISSVLVLSLTYREFMALVSITDTVFEPILLIYNLLVIGLIAIPTGESPTEDMLSITLLVIISITETLSES